MSDLFARAQAVKVLGNAAGPTQAVERTQADLNRLEELVNAIEREYPGFEVNEPAIAKGGTTATGQAVVVFACKRRLPTPAAVTVYHNGTAVWAGVKPVSLDEPAKARKARKTEPAAEQPA